MTSGINVPYCLNEGRASSTERLLIFNFNFAFRIRLAIVVTTVSPTLSQPSQGGGTMKVSYKVFKDYRMNSSAQTDEEKLSNVSEKEAAKARENLYSFVSMS